MNITEREREKYAKIWAIPDYSENSPGAQLVARFLSLCEPPPGARIVDVGAGSGAGAKSLHALGYDVVAFDLNRPEDWVHHGIAFDTGCIWRDLKGWGELNFDYAYCCDVLEHIPTQFVGLAIAQVLHVARKAFFSVSFTQDVMGDAIRDRLHLTVRPFTWWVQTFRELGAVIEARDILGEGLFVVQG